MANYTALFDACVLYRAQVRDLLLHLAQAALFRAKWTGKIHEEWIRNLVLAGRDQQRLQRTRELMDRAIPDCLITGYESLIESLELPDKNDRHVLAAAIIGNVDVIVTYNLKDFPKQKLAPFGIEAQHPDDFVLCQIDLAPERACAAVKLQRSSLKNPPKTVEEFLADLAKVDLPQSVERLRGYSHLI